MLYAKLFLHYSHWLSGVELGHIIHMSDGRQKYPQVSNVLYLLLLDGIW